MYHTQYCVLHCVLRTTGCSCSCTAPWRILAHPGASRQRMQGTPPHAPADWCPCASPVLSAIAPPGPPQHSYPHYSVCTLATAPADSPSNAAPTKLSTAPSRPPFSSHCPPARRFPCSSRRHTLRPAATCLYCAPTLCATTRGPPGDAAGALQASFPAVTVPNLAEMPCPMLTRRPPIRPAPYPPASPIAHAPFRLDRRPANFCKLCTLETPTAPTRLMSFLRVRVHGVYKHRQAQWSLRPTSQLPDQRPSHRPVSTPLLLAATKPDTALPRLFCSPPERLHVLLSSWHRIQRELACCRASLESLAHPIHTQYCR